MSAPLTDDLIKRLLEVPDGRYALLCHAAAEALAAASRPQPEPLKNGIGGYHIKDVRGPLDVASPTQSALTTASLVKETAGFFNSTSSAAPPPWQPIETLPPSMRDTELLFWVVPKTPEESYCNTDGDPIYGTFEPYLFKGKSKTWSSLSKATHWLPLPSPPASAPQPTTTTNDDDHTRVDKGIGSRATGSTASDNEVI